MADPNCAWLRAGSQGTSAIGLLLILLALLLGLVLRVYAIASWRAGTRVVHLAGSRPAFRSDQM